MKIYIDTFAIPFSVLKEAITKCDSKNFFQCTLEDLMPDPTRSNGLGIYIFESNGVVEYIGKSGGRNVVERLGGHIDHRLSGIMNYYARMLAVSKTNIKWTKHKDWTTLFSDVDRTRMLIDVRNDLKFRSLKIIYLGSEVDHNFLGELEKLLTINFRPLLQAHSIKRRDIDEAKDLKSLLNDFVSKTKKKEAIVAIDERPSGA